MITTMAKFLSLRTIRLVPAAETQVLYVLFSLSHSSFFPHPLSRWALHLRSLPLPLSLGPSRVGFILLIANCIISLHYAYQPLPVFPVPPPPFFHLPLPSSVNLSLSLSHFHSVSILEIFFLSLSHFLFPLHISKITIYPLSL